MFSTFADCFVLVHWGGIFSPFMQMYLTWGPSTWALAFGCPPLFSLLLLYVSQNTVDHFLLLVRSKVTITYWVSLETQLIGTERRAQVRPSCFICERCLFQAAGIYIIKGFFLFTLSTNLYIYIYLFTARSLGFFNNFFTGLWREKKNYKKNWHRSGCAVRRT